MPGLTLSWHRRPLSPSEGLRDVTSRMICSPPTQALQVPAFRASGLVNAARRVLNVDQAQVLSIDTTADEIVLDVRLLRLQFEIGGGP